MLTPSKCSAALETRYEADRAVTGKTFVKLVVHDLEKMTRYYTEVFGLKELQRVIADIAGSPVEETILGTDDGEPQLVVMTWTDRPGPSAGEVIVGFWTTDIAGVFARAHEAGGQVLEEPRVRTDAGGLRVGFVADPEGHLAEVIERG